MNPFAKSGVMVLVLLVAVSAAYFLGYSKGRLNSSDQSLAYQHAISELNEQNAVLAKEINNEKQSASAIPSLESCQPVLQDVCELQLGAHEAGLDGLDEKRSEQALQGQNHQDWVYQPGRTPDFNALSEDDIRQWHQSFVNATQDADDFSHDDPDIKMLEELATSNLELALQLSLENEDDLYLQFALEDTLRPEHAYLLSPHLERSEVFREYALGIGMDKQDPQRFMSFFIDELQSDSDWLNSYLFESVSDQIIGTPYEGLLRKKVVTNVNAVDIILEMEIQGYENTDELYLKAWDNSKVDLYMMAWSKVLLSVKVAALGSRDALKEFYRYYQAGIEGDYVEYDALWMSVVDEPVTSVDSDDALSLLTYNAESRTWAFR